MKEKKKHNRKAWFRCLCKFLGLFIRKPRYVFFGEKITRPSIILSNHVGKSAPLTYECHFKEPFRFWGAHEMNDGLGSVYKYMSEVFYHQKKHWPLFWARLFCIIAAPLVNIFYKGLRLISTYNDARAKTTINESINSLNNNESIIIFPENSDNGYFDELKELRPGFVLFAKTCLKRGIDVPIYVFYFHKKKRMVIMDKPILASELLADGVDKAEIAKKMCDKMNALYHKVNLLDAVCS